MKPLPGRGGLRGQPDVLCRRHERHPRSTPGSYAIGVMKWGALEMLLYGIMLSDLGGAGRLRRSLAGRRPRPQGRAVQIEIFMSLLGIIAMLGMAPDQILYFWAYDAACPCADVGRAGVPHPAGVDLRADRLLQRGLHHRPVRLQPHHADAPDAAGADRQPSSGSMRCRAWRPIWLGSDPGEPGHQYLTGSQQGGFAMLLVLLALGLAGLAFVRGGGRERTPLA
jgi:UMF1 family MFS transporter